jgi:hypothetical protein
LLDSSGIAIAKFNHINESAVAVRLIDETTWARDETILGRRRSQPETHYQATWSPLVKRKGSIMWAIISSIYRAYCYERLLEMRSNHRRASHA